MIPVFLQTIRAFSSAASSTPSTLSSNAKMTLSSRVENIRATKCPPIRFAGGGGAAEGQEDGLDGGSLDNTAMYPQPKLVQEGTLKVSEIHTIAYKEYGNPDGKPVVFVHGGPGADTAPEDARYFDPEVYRIVLVDQRGCGKSTPFANLEENTTWDLVSDFEKIRNHLGIDKWMVFGGSWGSTLGLAYAISHPDRTTELVLRGIFLLRQKDLDFFYEGKGTNYLFPAQWEDFQKEIPDDELREANGSYIVAYGRRLRGEKGDAAMASASKSWTVWEGSTSRLINPPKEKILGQWAGDDFSLAFARIENHYFSSGGKVPEVATGFFPREGWLLEEENLSKICDIPTVIVQGRYDVVCPAASAYELHTKLRKLTAKESLQTLHIVTTGHSGLEPGIIEKLVEATDSFRP
jgi:proline iminopeptidase